VGGGSVLTLVKLPREGFTRGGTDEGLTAEKADDLSLALPDLDVVPWAGLLSPHVGSTLMRSSHRRLGVAAPDDGEEVAGTELLVYEAPR
jgi:hypothetical protein